MRWRREGEIMVRMERRKKEEVEERPGRAKRDGGGRGGLGI